MTYKVKIWCNLDHIIFNIQSKNSEPITSLLLILTFIQQNLSISFSSDPTFSIDIEHTDTWV